MDESEENYFLAAMLQLPGIGRRTAAALIAAFGSARAVWEADRGDLFLSKQLSEKELAAFLSARTAEGPERLAEECRRKGIGVVAKGDAHYPSLLAEIPDAPLALFYRGQLPDFRAAVAVVGTRRATHYGLAVAKDMAAWLAARELTVVSGGAIGIDGAAHEGALAKGVTVAVLGCGVDVVYPPRHRALFEQIVASGGALLSEYPPGAKPAPGCFPARNRIISGLCKGVLVVEAGHRSGALITADLALDYDREVFCIPGSIYSPVSHGVHDLIRQGAHLIERPDDILTELGLLWFPDVQEEKKAEPLSAEEEKILACCCEWKPVMGDAILDQTEFTPAEAANLLLSLQIKGLVRRGEDGYWRLKGR